MEATTEQGIPREVMEALEEFEAVFKESTGLPLTRPQDHAITLKEGTNIPNLWPYWCPHSHKKEIENLVANMLKMGIISPSTIPIILVKKKDENKRFCVDHRALNKATTNFLCL